MEEWSELTLLFLSAFLAATILPAQSEIVLAAMHAQNQYDVWLLVTTATIGNVMGAVVNLVLGRYLIHFQDKKWFPIDRESIKKATNIYQKYGVWTLLLAWMPVIGDPLTLVAGIFKTRFLIFLILVTIGKAARYIGIIVII